MSSATSAHTDILEAALVYLAQGRSVFPVVIKPKPGGGFSKDIAKTVAQRPMQKAFTPEELRALWTDDANGIGMELGAVSGVIRLDAEGSVPWEQLGEQPDGGEFTTPSGGRGWLIEYSSGIRTDRIWKGEGHAELKLMCDGLYTVVPPSERYEWVNGSQLCARLPDWMLSRQAERALAELAPPTIRNDTDPCEVKEALEHIDADDRDRWIEVGMALKLLGEQYFEVWERWSRNSNKFVEGECEQLWRGFRDRPLGRCVTVGSIFHWAKQGGWRPTKVLHEPLTDIGNANMLSRLGAGRICHSSEWGWLAYEKGKWQQGGDAEKVVQELQKEVLRVRMDAAVKSLARHLNSDRDADGYTTKLKTKQRTIGMIRSCEDNSAMKGAREQATSIPALSADYRKFDQHPYLLNCPNGTLDLKLRELRPHDPTDLLTRMCPTEYHQDAMCPRWECFLREVFDGDEGQIRYMHKFLGYCITGLTTHHILPLWLGSGRNGKSTIVWAMCHVLGEDYADTAPQDFLKSTTQSRHPTEVADLYGKRFVADLETDANMYLNESRVKRLTGGDKLKGRWMRDDFFEFEPTHKLVIASNNEPNVRFMDPALQSRIKKVPFNVSFRGREDHFLKEKLAAEAQGILAWLVRGCYLFLDEGLKDADIIKKATEEYQDEQNTVKQFAEQMLSREGKTRTSSVMAAYKAWCVQNGVVKPVEGKPFWNQLREQGIGKDKNDAFCSIKTG